ncbi:FAD:protein FMN transferase [Thioclava sp. BHET1]|nr:FAD:protein FMN transferase [Thioclava sp. BHET1]
MRSPERRSPVTPSNARCKGRSMTRTARECALPEQEAVVSETRITMGMPVTLTLIDPPRASLIAEAFALFAAIDQRFSPYRETSELCRLNRGELDTEDLSTEFRHILALAEAARQESGGWFDIRCPGGGIDTSGIVKGWAIARVAALLRQAGAERFCVEAGGDLQTCGARTAGHAWRIGIRNPFALSQVVEILGMRGQAIATSGNYIRGNHIYDPLSGTAAVSDLVSLSVIAPDILQADLLATTAFAIGRPGLDFLAGYQDVEACAIDAAGIMHVTPGWQGYVLS